jgi:hypothetical protein
MFVAVLQFYSFLMLFEEYNEKKTFTDNVNIFSNFNIPDSRD